MIVNEVAPRDGLQNLPQQLAVPDRLRLIRSLLSAGIRSMEVGAFVSPRAVPQMAGSDRLLAALPAAEGRRYIVLVPNLKGYQLARVAGVESVSVPVSVTDEMNSKNLNMSTAEIMAQTRELLAVARRDGVYTLIYLSVAFECPFAGEVDPQRVLEMAVQLRDAGADRLIIADTIGAAHPGQVKYLLQLLVAELGVELLGCHFHDTRALALANTYAALEAGIRHFDSSVAGLGGCPFAPGAAGNIATEDLVLLLTQMGFDTGIDLSELMAASQLAARLTDRPSAGGRSAAWLASHLDDFATGSGQRRTLLHAVDSEGVSP